ncbi:hypothetical protein ABT023_12705 [Micromonospora sp. NPDC002296]|uniref:hypothetical protein n=1 Tax=Micromonospora sp. NPDC002296 TaxID=3154271 RepID=UPI00331763B2
MRDLTVANVHTYYVIAGNTPVLVHNCGDALFDNKFPDDVVRPARTIENSEILSQSGAMGYVVTADAARCRPTHKHASSHRPSSRRTGSRRRGVQGTRRQGAQRGQ